MDDYQQANNDFVHFFSYSLFMTLTRTKKTIRKATRIAAEAATLTRLLVHAKRHYSSSRMMNLMLWNAERLMSILPFGQLATQVAELDSIVDKVDAARNVFMLSLGTYDQKLFNNSKNLTFYEDKLRATALAKKFQLSMSHLDSALQAMVGLSRREAILGKIQENRDRLKMDIARLQDSEEAMQAVWFKGSSKLKVLADIKIEKRSLQLVQLVDRFLRQRYMRKVFKDKRETLQGEDTTLPGGVQNIEGICAVNAPVVAILNLEHLREAVANKHDPIADAFREMHGSSSIEQVFDIEPLRKLIAGIRPVKGAVGGQDPNLFLSELIDKWEPLKRVTRGTARFGDEFTTTSVQILMKMDRKSISLSELLELNQFELVNPPKVLIFDIWNFNAHMFGISKADVVRLTQDQNLVVGIITGKVIPDIAANCEVELKAARTQMLNAVRPLAILKDFNKNCLEGKFSVSVDFENDSRDRILSGLKPLLGPDADVVIESAKRIIDKQEEMMNPVYNVTYNRTLSLGDFNYTLRATTEIVPMHTYTVAWLKDGCYEVNDEHKKKVPCEPLNSAHILYYELDEAVPAPKKCDSKHVLDKQLNECLDRSLLDTFLREGHDYKKIQASLFNFGSTKLYDRLVLLGGAELSMQDRDYLKSMLADLSTMATHERAALKVPFRKRKESIPIKLLTKLELLDADERSTFFRLVDKKAFSAIDWPTVNAICYEEGNCHLLGCRSGLVRGVGGACVEPSFVDNWGPSVALTGAGLSAAVLLPRLLRARRH